MKPDSPEPPRADSAADGTDSERSMRTTLERRLGGVDAGGTRCAPPVIADHVLLHRVGRGAYGEVWLARSALGTLRAVKIVYRASFEEERPYDREFHGILKYEPISRTHEGLVQVLHVGRNDEAGCFYYVMELADSVSSFEFRVSGSAAHPEFETRNSELETYAPRTLRSELKHHQRLAPADAAQLVLRLAGALAHLHGHGLVHRDIKPSNVIFVNGHPKLADVGLVAGAGDSRSFVGTEGFIPPEGPGTAAADIYSLGKLLYELATGRDRLEFPQLPSELMQMPEREALLELNEVITRASAPEPAQRYGSAAELAADLNLFLAGRSLREARRAERHLAWLKRAAVAAGIVAVLASGLVGWAKREEHRAEQRARVESGLRARAEAAEHESRRQLHTALLEQARSTVRSGELGHRVRALDALRRAAAISNTVELRREAMAAFALPDLRLEQEWRGGNDVTCAQFDPDFKRIAVSRGDEATEIFSGTDFKKLATLPAGSPGACYRTIWSADGRHLLVKRDLDDAGNRSAIEVWDVARAQRVLLLPGVPRDATAFHPTQPRLAAGTVDGGITVWDLEDGSGLPLLKRPAVIDRLKYSADAKKLVASYPIKSFWTVSVHDAETGALLVTNQFSSRLAYLDVDPQGRWIAVADVKGLIHLMDMDTGFASAIGKHPSAAATTCFSPDGNWLVTGGWERELICWDMRTRQRSFTMPLDSFYFQFSRDGRQGATFADGRVQRHAFEAPSAVRDLGAVLGSQVLYATFSPDGRWLAASGDRRLGLWSLTNEVPVALVKEGADARPYFTPDSGELFGSSRVEAGFRWRIITATNAESPLALERIPLAKLRAFTSLCLALNSVVWTAGQGSRVASLSADAETEAWVDTPSGVNQASADGRWLGIYRPFTPVLHVHRLPGLEAVVKLTAQGDILTFSFSPQGDEVAAASRGAVEFWNLASGQRSRVLTNFTGIVFAPDGRHAWLRRDRRAGLYDLTTLEPLLLLPNGMQPLALSPDGRHLAVTLEARRVQVWDLVEVKRRLQEMGLNAGF